MTKPMKSPRTNEALVASVGTMRVASFTTALAATLMLMLFPFLLRGVPDTRLHSALPIVMLGIVGAFVYGIGFTPDHALLRMLFGPWCCWTLMAVGAVVLAL
jgi:predicted membrane protein